MDHDYAQRRRLAAAIAITVIAAPAAFLLNRSGDGDTTLTTGAVAAADSPTTSGEPVPTSPLGTAPVGYLSGSTLPTEDEPVRIAIPQLGPSIKGVASYSSTIPSTTRCQASGVPYNATVTITNLDNSRRVQCIANVAGVPRDVDIVLANDTFAEIADLTDAPVPVEITWVAPITAPPAAAPQSTAPATAAP